MFVAQGVRQFEIWTGKPAPIADMAFAVTTALGRRLAAAGPHNGHGAPTTEVKAEETVDARPKVASGKNGGAAHKKAAPQPAAKKTVRTKPAAKSASHAAAKHSSAKPTKTVRR
jgi:3-dehydroquinate dehydratase/shikimate dehydrogenase